MGQLFDHIHTKAKAAPDKIALYAEDEEYSYQEIMEATSRWEAILSHRATPEPLRLVILSEDPLHLISLSLLMAKINATAMPLNCQLTAAQISRLCARSHANLIICDPHLHNRLSDLEIALCATSAFEEPMVSKGTLPIGSEDHPDFLITFSSGSTGAPKPIMIDQKTKQRRAEQSIDLYGLEDSDVVLCASPFFHSLGQRLCFVALCAGAALVMLNRFTPHNWLLAVQNHRVSFVIAVASHLVALKDDLFAFSDQLKSLRTLVASSAPMAGDFKDRLFQTLGCEFHEIYGATEIAIATNLAPHDGKDHFDTVGQACTNVELKILDEDLKELPPGEIGEIAVCSPLAFSGYYGQETLSEESFCNGYFLTGDLGKLDQAGFLSYVARKKDIIISGGINIYPKDIEDALLENPDLSEVAVIGVPDDLLGEVIVAICVSPQGKTLEKTLRLQVNKTLAPFQRPLKYFFIDALPLGPTGKVAKQDLRETYAALNTDWTDALRHLMYGASPAQEGS